MVHHCFSRYLFMLLSTTAHGQYAAGLHVDVAAVGPVHRVGVSALRPETTWATGLFVQVPLNDRSGYRLALDHVTRRSGITRYADHGRKEVVMTQATFVQLLTIARFRLGERSPLYFAVGPQIGLQLTERTTGVSFIEYPPGQADSLQLDERFWPSRISDIRLYLGLGADLPITEQFTLVVNMAAAPGQGSWFHGGTCLSVEPSVGCGLAYRPPPRVRRR